jgi:fructose-bisphosphate aldolase class II
MVPLLRAAEEASLRYHPTAIGAYNVNFPAQAEGVLRGLQATDAPGIVQASKGANKFQGGPDKIQYMLLKAMAEGCITIPVALHLDHGDEQSAKACIDCGFSSVMIDASKGSFDDNVLTSNRIFEYAHPRGVSVEAEYGQLSGVEEDVVAAQHVYADPAKVAEFFSRSGVDALAIAYGTSHGPNKGKTDALNLRIVGESYDSLRERGMNLERFLVSHGSSTVPPAFVATINQYGGALEGARGVPEYMIVRAICLGMRKINIDTDLRLAMTGEVRRWLHENPDAASPAVDLIRGVFDGRIEAYEGDKIIDPTQLKDPRSWLQPIMDADPTLLRENYTASNDSVFIEVMELIRGTVATHVANLNHMFGSVGLADWVER